MSVDDELDPQEYFAIVEGGEFTRRVSRHALTWVLLAHWFCRIIVTTPPSRLMPVFLYFHPCSWELVNAGNRRHCAQPSIALWGGHDAVW